MHDGELGDVRTVGSPTNEYSSQSLVNILRQPSARLCETLCLPTTQCDKYGAIQSFFEQILNEPTKVGWVGSGCSLATVISAELTPFYNLTQV